MLVKKPGDVKPSEITDEKDYIDRRKFIGATTAALLGAGGSQAAAGDAEAGVEIGRLIKSPYSTDEDQTPVDKASGYVNFYEFALDKHSPARLARDFRTDPWTVAVEGEANKKGVYNLEDILRPHKLEERIYRMRCVEAWSMVIPWIGFPLGELLKRFEPTSKARFVEFETLYDPRQMPGQGDPVLRWPYKEGLRMDEAMHPLTIMAVGMYGEVLPNQNGAPLRLVVPWKYGFKSVKSIVKIRFMEKQPISSWTEAAPREYGFYANVNPEVDHPRWSQATERRIGDMLRKKTLMFNGYGDQVERLYRGMDLRKNF